MVLGVVALIGTLSGGCAGDERPPSSPTRDDRPARQRSKLSRVPQSTRVACAVGERPRYFVPGPADAPAALLGCARLGVSGKRVEFSGNVAHIDGGRHACVNPAYRGRGQRGLYIPAMCRLEPALSRFAVRDAAQPRQGVRDYAYVISGTAGASTDVVANFAGATPEAAVFRVEGTLPGRSASRRSGCSSWSFHSRQRASPVTVSDGRPAATERIPPQSKLCERTRGSPGRGSP